MHICKESAVLRHQNDDLSRMMIDGTPGERGGLLHIAPVTPQNEIVLHPNKSVSRSYRKNMFMFRLRCIGHVVWTLAQAKPELPRRLCGKELCPINPLIPIKSIYISIFSASYITWLWTADTGRWRRRSHVLALIIIDPSWPFALTHLWFLPRVNVWIAFKHNIQRI